MVIVFILTSTRIIYFTEVGATSRKSKNIAVSEGISPRQLDGASTLLTIAFKLKHNLNKQVPMRPAASSGRCLR